MSEVLVIDELATELLKENMHILKGEYLSPELQSSSINHILSIVDKIIEQPILQGDHIVSDDTLVKILSFANNKLHDGGLALLGNELLEIVFTGAFQPILELGATDEN